jgi:hypothetical protein
LNPDINNPKKFAAEFNQTVPNAFRKVDAEDIQYMTDCGLIRRYSGCYIRDDLQTVLGVLNYEHLQQNRQVRSEIKDEDGTLHCKRCRTVLADQPHGSRGRPREFCEECEHERLKERNRKYWEKKKAERICKS